MLFSTEFQETDLPHPISIPPQNPVNGEDFVYAELPPGHEAKAEASVFKGSMVSPTVLETFPHWTLAGESQDLLGGLDFSDLIRIEENEDEAGFRVSFEKAGLLQNLPPPKVSYNLVNSNFRLRGKYLGLIMNIQSREKNLNQIQRMDLQAIQKMRKMNVRSRTLRHWCLALTSCKESSI